VLAYCRKCFGKNFSDDAHKKLANFVKKNKEMMHGRIRSGFLRDIHGDFKTDNIFFSSGKFLPFDRLEYNDKYRRRDVAHDVASLLCDFYYYDKSKWARVFLHEYLKYDIGDGLINILDYFLLYRCLLKSVILHTLGRHQKDNIAGTYFMNSERYRKLSERFLI
jgi:aminoglycoside phosphotransferase family enzyme